MDKDTDHIIEVYMAANPIEAHTIRGALEAEGITARVVGDVLESGSGLPPGPDTEPRVWVRQQDEAAARKIIEEWEAKERGESTTPPLPAWKCSRCGADVDGEFELCWQCGAEKPEP